MTLVRQDLLDGHGVIVVTMWMLSHGDEVPILAHYKLLNLYLHKHLHLGFLNGVVVEITTVKISENNPSRENFTQCRLI